MSDNERVVPATSNTIGRLTGPSSDPVVCYNQAEIPVDKRLSVVIVNSYALRALEEKCKTLERVAAAISLLHNVVTEAKTMLDKMPAEQQQVTIELKPADFDIAYKETEFFLPVETDERLRELIFTVITNWLSRQAAVKITITP